MKALVVKVSELLNMDTEKSAELNFNKNKKQLCIPLYQREYTWKNDSVSVLINDIIEHEKFLGNIILDEKEKNYEIIDGQQRITTCILILAAVYNQNNGHPMTQNIIKKYIQPNDKDIILANESVGNYIEFNDGLAKLIINSDDDCYNQRDDFDRVFNHIGLELEKLANYEQQNNFLNNLLNCDLLVLINNSQERYRPVEQLFLDINEKAQLLKVEDIFKGHCFNIFDKSYHKELKNKWVNLKKIATLFQEFGFEDTSNYIYLYLLETDSLYLKENLLINGKHYLHGKTIDEVAGLLNAMIDFGEKISDFYNDIKKSDYQFDNICKNSSDYKNTKDFVALRLMCCSILCPGDKAIYQKLPFLFSIYCFITLKNIKLEIKHADFRKIITNLYIYSELFILSKSKKSKKQIDQSVRKSFFEEDPINQVIIASKKLRSNALETFTIDNTYSFDKLCFIYSIIDNYVSDSNWIKFIYSHDNNFTLEHFIIPDIRSRKIKWKNDDKEIELVIPTTIAKKHKKTIFNQLVMDKKLNEKIEHYDIVFKIQEIKSWYKVREKDIPKHINLFIKNIEKMPEYSNLIELKNKEIDKDELLETYTIFLEQYFNNLTDSLRSNICKAFIDSFKN